MSVLQPFNFQKWLDENRELLKPPVANKNLTPDSDEYIVMVVAGPNARKDYHYNETEEFFYQLEGNITVNVQVDGEVRSLDLGPGDMMTVPAKVPHSPVRHEGSIGLVVERKREGCGYTDGLLWFCDSCNHKLHETYFELKNIETDFLPRFKEYYASEEKRTCDKCGTTMESDPRFV
jgi:3-hydroxyanthranilate 3,4-dioxygenase